MNRSLLEDDDYIEDITKMVQIWIAEGQKKPRAIVTFGIG